MSVLVVPPDWCLSIRVGILSIHVGIRAGQLACCKVATAFCWWPDVLGQMWASLCMGCSSWQQSIHVTKCEHALAIVI